MTRSPTRRLRASSWVNGSVSCRSSARSELFKARHRAVVGDVYGRPTVDPAVEAHGNRHKAMAVSIVDVDCERGGVTAGAHGSEARLVYRCEQPRFHVPNQRIFVQAANLAERRPLGHLGGVVEGTTNADADHHRRTVLRAGLQHAFHEICLDLADRRIAEDLPSGPATRAKGLRRTGDFHVIGTVNHVEWKEWHVPALVAALERQRVGDEFQDRGLNRLDKVGEAVDEGTANVAAEAEPCTDLHEIGWKTCVRAGVPVFTLGRPRRRLPERQPLLRGWTGFPRTRGFHG